jgi:integrase
MNTFVVTAPSGNAAPWAASTYSEAAAGPFSVLYRESGKREQARWAEFWQEALETWLSTGRRRSEHTRRAYREAVRQFEDFLTGQGVIRLWHVTGRHVVEWTQYMEANGASKRTIAARLAACSSYYRHVIHTTSLWAGREVSLFVDAYGAPRSNPFDDSLVQRPRVDAFSDAKPVTAEAFQWIISYLQENNGPLASVEHKRNLALMLAFGFSGWRNDEVISMTWGRIQEGRQPGTYTYKWTGKARDGAFETRALPALVVDAIVAYLRADGRYRPGKASHIQDDDCIWRPVRTAGCANFPNVTGELPENRHISPSSANSVLRGLLRRYYKSVAAQRGIYGPAQREWARERAAQFTIHGLRHLFAHELYKGSGNNIKLVSERLGHKSLATTQVYLAQMEEPVDDFSDVLAKQYGLNSLR